MSKIKVIQNGWEQLPLTTFADDKGKQWLSRMGFDHSGKAKHQIESKHFNIIFHSREVEFTPVRALHLHPAREEMFLVLEGRGKGIVYEKEIDLEPGTIIYVPPGARHYFQAFAKASGNAPIKITEIGTGMALIPPNVAFDVYVGKDGAEKVKKICESAVPPITELLKRITYENEADPNAPEIKVIQNGWEQLPLTTFADDKGKQWLARGAGCDHTGLGRDNIGSKHFNIILHSKEPGYTAPKLLHLHPIREELFVVLEGRGKGIVDEKEIDLEPGTIIHVPAGARHYVQVLATPVGDEPLKMIEVGSADGLTPPGLERDVYIGREDAEKAEALMRSAVPPLEMSLKRICYENE